MNPETIDAYRAVARDINDDNRAKLDKANDRIAELEAQLSRAMNVVTAAERIVNWKKARFDATDSIHLERALKDNGWTV